MYISINVHIQYLCYLINPYFFCRQVIFTLLNVCITRRRAMFKWITFYIKIKSRYVSYKVHSWGTFLFLLKTCSLMARGCCVHNQLNLQVPVAIQDMDYHRYMLCHCLCSQIFRWEVVVDIVNHCWQFKPWQRIVNLLFLYIFGSNNATDLFLFFVEWVRVIGAYFTALSEYQTSDEENLER